MRRIILTFVPLSLLSCALGGCVAKTLVNVVTLPVRAASSAVDLATTSQSEADQKRGRELREREERYGELERKFIREDRRCYEGNDSACQRREALRTEMNALRPSLPASSD